MRAPFLILVIGTNGTGKTTFCKELIEQKINEGQRALIVTNHIGEWTDTESIDIRTRELSTFTGIRKTHMNKDLFLELKRFYNGILVFDDARRYINAKIENTLEDILISRRQQMLDIFAVGHSFSKIPRSFYTYASHLCLFKTTEHAKTRSDVLCDIDKIIAMQQIVNNEFDSGNTHYYNIYKF